MDVVRWVAATDGHSGGAFCYAQSCWPGECGRDRDVSEALQRRWASYFELADLDMDLLVVGGIGSSMPVLI